MRATVLFPLPLSPTRATIFPGLSAKLTSSLAWSMIFVPPGRREPPTLKCLLRFRASRIGSVAVAGRIASACIAHFSYFPQLLLHHRRELGIACADFGRQSVDSPRP